VQHVKIRQKTALPLAEISALALRGGVEGKAQLLAVGDGDFAVLSVELDNGRELAHTWRHELLLVLREAQIDGTQIDVESKSGSGFEGVASDRTGTILLLQEEEARLLVMAPDLSRLLQVLELAVPVDHPELGTAWHRKPNARGEGLLLLKQGHVLIAKQSNEACLIEFGSPTSSPIGISKKTILAPGNSFERPAAEKSELVPLAVWPLTEDTKEALPTINDLALGPDGQVYALSAHAHTIARLQQHLKPGEHANAKRTWRIDEGLPGGDEARPEGLAFLPSGHPLVSIDTKRAGANVVVLQPLGDH
jgi:hypothetical protein